MKTTMQLKKNCPIEIIQQVIVKMYSYLKNMILKAMDLKVLKEALMRKAMLSYLK